MKKIYLAVLILLFSMTVACGKGMESPQNDMSESSISVTFDASECIGLLYSDVVDKVKDLGFSEVSFDTILLSSLNESDKINTVAEIQIAGNTNFLSGLSFKPTDEVIIKYYEMPPYKEVPLSKEDSLGMAYKDLVGLYKEQGFTDITTNPVDISEAQDTHLIDTVESISVAGTKEFDDRKEIFLSDEVCITYYIMPPTIVLSCSQEKYIGREFNEVVEEIQTLGFENIVVIEEKLTDAKLIDQTNVVFEVAFDGCLDYKENDVFLQKDLVEVKHYVMPPTSEFPYDSKNIRDKLYQEVYEALVGRGFNNIQTEKVLLESIEQKKSDGLIASLVIRESDLFENGEIFLSDDPIKITYYEMPPYGCIPISAKDCVGASSDEVLKSFKDNGFNNITCLEEKLLSIDDVPKVGCVAAVLINENDDFSAGDEFFLDTPVVITKYIIDPYVEMPFSAESCMGQDYATIESQLKKLGFKNIVKTENSKIYPNVEPKDKGILSILVDGSSFVESTPFFINSAVEIEYYVEPIYNVSMEFNLAENWLFNIFGIEVLLDGKKITSLNQGESKTINEKLKGGSHKIEVHKIGDTSINGEEEFEVLNDSSWKFSSTTYTSSVSCSSKLISGNEYPTDRVVLQENEVMVPIGAVELRGDDYSIAESQLRSAGFTNITMDVTYDLSDSMWDSVDIGDVTSITIDGKSFAKYDIFKIDDPVVICYRDLITNDPNLEYTKVSVKKLVSDLEDNAYNAKEKYNGQYVEITGEVSNIDASGRYFVLNPTGSYFCLTGVLCSVDKDEHKEEMLNLKTERTIIVRGKITSVGEITGYMLDLISFE